MEALAASIEAWNAHLARRRVQHELRRNKAAYEKARKGVADATLNEIRMDKNDAARVRHFSRIMLDIKKNNLAFHKDVKAQRDITRRRDLDRGEKLSMMKEHNRFINFLKGSLVTNKCYQLFHHLMTLIVNIRERNEANVTRARQELAEFQEKCDFKEFNHEFEAKRRNFDE